MRYIFFLLLFISINSTAQITPQRMAGGIGARIKIDTKSGYPVIAEILPGSAADSAGLRADDVILKLDSISAKGFELEDAVVLIRGPVNSKLIMLVRRGNAELYFEVIRQKVDFD